MKNKKEVMVRRLFTDNAQFRASEDKDGKPTAEGTFVVFNTPTNLFGDYYEQILPEAINLERDLKIHDIAALANHDDSLPLARVSNETLELWKDEKGLHGRIHFNPKDSEAMNWYERIKSGVVYQNSFGFYVRDSELSSREEGGTLESVLDLELIEVSPVTFPAYSDTQINARKRNIEDRNKNTIKEKRNKLMEKLQEVVKQ